VVGRPAPARCFTIDARLQLRAEHKSLIRFNSVIMTEQSSAVGECLSQIFSTIYFDKSIWLSHVESLKLLLEERNDIIHKLDLKPQRGDFHETVDAVLLLFNEEPLEL